MAIIIPQNKIFDINFKLLNDNYIDRVYANITNEYNYNNINVNLSYDGRIWHVDRTDEIPNGEITFYTTDVSIDTNYDGEENSASKIYASLTGYFSLNNDLYKADRLEDLIESVTLKINLSDFATGTEEVLQEDINFTTDSNPNMPLVYNNISNIGVMAFLSIDKNYYGHWSSKMNFKLLILTSIVTKSLVPVFIKTAKNATLIIKPKNVNNILNYQYTINEKDFSDFSLSNVSLYHEQNGTINDTHSDIDTPIYQVVSKNIVDKYKNGRMMIELETRYTTFKDENGNDINNGKPYLIKVEDIVKPEMTGVFKKFEDEYIVTSAEYECNGADILHLKLLQK